MSNQYTLIAEAMPPRTKIVKNQVALLEKSTKKFGDIPKIFGAFKDKIGIEVEAENINKLPDESIYWNCVPDGSLKKAGNEYVSCPIGGHNIDYALHELKSFLVKNNVEWSHRTSIHVHAGVGDLTVGQIKALVSAYAVLEKLFFNQVEEHRRGNPYCYYLTDTNPRNVEYGDEHQKYCAFNFGNCLREFNTVEFRHMQGTGDFRQIRRWLMMIVKLIKFIRSNKPEKVIATILALNSTSEYHSFVKEVFGTSLRFFVGLDFQKEMEEGVLWAKMYNFSGEF